MLRFDNTVTANADGYVTLESEGIGRAAVALGAGRATLDDAVDPGVGIEILAGQGTRVAAGEPVLLVRHRDARGLDSAAALLADAVIISATPPPARPLIVETITHV